MPTLNTPENMLIFVAGVLIGAGLANVIYVMHVILDAWRWKKYH